MGHNYLANENKKKHQKYHLREMVQCVIYVSIFATHSVPHNWDSKKQINIINAEESWNPDEWSSFC